MTSKKDSLWRWWSKFEQINQLADIMSKPLSGLLDEYLAYQPQSSDSQHRGEQLVGFDEYIMHRAIAEVCRPRPRLPPRAPRRPPALLARLQQSAVLNAARARAGGGRVRCGARYRISCGCARGCFSS